MFIFTQHVQLANCRDETRDIKEGLVETNFNLNGELTRGGAGMRCIGVPECVVGASYESYRLALVFRKQLRDCGLSWISCRCEHLNSHHRLVWNLDDGN